MGNSNSKYDTAFPFHLLERIGDLTWFEGPLLTLFRQKSTGKLYLFDWVDSNDTANIWMVYPISKKGLSGFLEGRISRQHLVENAPDKRVRLVHLNHDLECIFDEWKAVSALPASYRPPADSFFDPADCPELGVFGLVVESAEAPLLATAA